MADKKRVAILFSGRGSNMIALLKAMKSPDFGAVPAILITDNPKAEGIENAGMWGFDCHIIDGASYKDKDSFDIELNRILDDARVDVVCLAGFMRILGEIFVNEWVGYALNVHPSLLPDYKGLDTHRRVLEAGEEETGASVHLVNRIVDSGAVLGNKTVKINENDTEETLAARVLHEEHKLYTLVLQDFLKSEKSLFDT